MAASLNFLSPGFSTNLLDCLLGGDIKACLFTWICGGIVNSETRVHIDGRDPWGWCDCCMGASPYAIRQKIRKDKGYPEARCFDCLALAFCQACYIYQNMKESDSPLIPTDFKRL